MLTVVGWEAQPWMDHVLAQLIGWGWGVSCQRRRNSSAAAAAAPPQQRRRSSGASLRHQHPTRLMEPFLPEVVVLLLTHPSSRPASAMFAGAAAWAT